MLKVDDFSIDITNLSTNFFCYTCNQIGVLGSVFFSSFLLLFHFLLIDLLCPMFYLFPSSISLSSAFSYSFDLLLSLFSSSMSTLIFSFLLLFSLSLVLPSTYMASPFGFSSSTFFLFLFTFCNVLFIHFLIL